ncbi:MAG: surA [Verrucomicrobia bacterium]|nr:surA [Verrucomicrobiota bacterium]
MKAFRLILGFTLALTLQAAAQTRTLNGIAVIVNEAVITYSEVEDFAGPALDAVRRTPLPAAQLQQKMTQIQTDALQQLVERQLILNDYKVSGYNLPESIIDDEINIRIRKQFGDRLRLTQTLQAQGGTYESYRRNIREQIIVDALAQKHVSSVVLISPYKIEQYFETNKQNFQLEDQVKLRMIVLNKPPGSDAAITTKLAKEILLKLDEGASFTEMAGIYSEGAQRAQQGDWGWVEKKKVLRPELDAVAFTLKKGQHSGVIETADACYILLVEDVRQAQVRPLPEVRDEIEKILVAEERSRLRRQYVERLTKKSFVRYY